MEQIAEEDAKQIMDHVVARVSSARVDKQWLEKWVGGKWVRVTSEGLGLSLSVGVCLQLLELEHRFPVDFVAPELLNKPASDVCNPLLMRATTLSAELRQLWPPGSALEEIITSRETPSAQLPQSVAAMGQYSGESIKQGIDAAGYLPLQFKDASELAGRCEELSSMGMAELVTSGWVEGSKASLSYPVVSYTQDQDPEAGRPKQGPLWAEQVDAVVDGLIQLGMVDTKGVWFDKLASRQDQKAQAMWPVVANLQFLVRPVVMVLPYQREGAFSELRRWIPARGEGGGDIEKALEDGLAHVLSCESLHTTSSTSALKLALGELDLRVSMEAFMRAWPSIERRGGAQGMGLFAEANAVLALAAVVEYLVLYLVQGMMRWEDPAEKEDALRVLRAVGLDVVDLTNSGTCEVGWFTVRKCDSCPHAGYLSYYLTDCLQELLWTLSHLYLPAYVQEAESLCEGSGTAGSGGGRSGGEEGTGGTPVGPQLNVPFTVAEDRDTAIKYGSWKASSLWGEEALGHRNVVRKIFEALRLPGCAELRSASVNNGGWQFSKISRFNNWLSSRVTCLLSRRRAGGLSKMECLEARQHMLGIIIDSAGGSAPVFEEGDKAMAALTFANPHAVLAAIQAREGLRQKTDTKRGDTFAHGEALSAKLQEMLESTHTAAELGPLLNHPLSSFVSLLLTTGTNCTRMWAPGVILPGAGVKLTPIAPCDEHSHTVVPFSVPPPVHFNGLWMGDNDLIPFARVGHSITTGPLADSITQLIQQKMLSEFVDDVNVVAVRTNHLADDTPRDRCQVCQAQEPEQGPGSPGGRQSEPESHPLSRISESLARGKQNVEIWKHTDRRGVQRETRIPLLWVGVFDPMHVMAVTGQAGSFGSEVDTTLVGLPGYHVSCQDISQATCIARMACLGNSSVKKCRTCPAVMFGDLGEGIDGPMTGKQQVSCRWSLHALSPEDKKALRHGL